MKNCPNCGRVLNDEDLYCPVCGTEQELPKQKKKKIHIKISPKMVGIGIAAVVVLVVFIVIMKSIMYTKRTKNAIDGAISAVKAAAENEEPFQVNVDIESTVYVSDSSNHLIGTNTYTDYADMKCDGKASYMTDGYSYLLYNPADVVNPQTTERDYEAYCTANGNVYCNWDEAGWYPSSYQGINTSDLTVFFDEIYDQIKGTESIPNVTGDNYMEGLNLCENGQVVIYGYLNDTSAVSNLYISIMELSGDEPSRGVADYISYEVYVSSGIVSHVQFAMGDLARYALLGSDGSDSLQTNGSGTFDISYTWNTGTPSFPDVAGDSYSDYSYSDDDYDEDESDDSSPEDLSSMYGYWQGNDAAVYIESNMVDGEENITAYCLYSDSGSPQFVTLSSIFDMLPYDLRINSTQLIYTRCLSDGSTSEYTLNLISDGKLTLLTDNEILHELTRTDVTSEDRSKFVGAWIDSGEPPRGESGREIDLELCDECGYVVESEESPDKILGHDESRKKIELYMSYGDMVYYIIPDLVGDDRNILSVAFYKYRLESDDVLKFEFCGGVTGYELTFNRAGSSNASSNSNDADDIPSDLVEAYENYTATMIGPDSYNMMDIDGDGIPECVVYCASGDVESAYVIVLSYKDEHIYSCGALSTRSKLYYSEGLGKFALYYWSDDSEWEGYTVYEMTNGDFKAVTDINKSYDSDLEEYVYTVNGESVDDGTYDDYVGDIEEENYYASTPSYNSIQDAFDGFLIDRPNKKRTRIS